MDRATQLTRLATLAGFVVAWAMMSGASQAGTDESERSSSLTKPPAATSSPVPLVGAIRWDAWQENGDIQATVERTLGPSHWHYRLPFVRNWMQKRLICLHIPDIYRYAEPALVEVPN